MCEIEKAIQREPVKIVDFTRGGRPLKASEVKITFSTETFNRKCRPEVEGFIENAWIAKLLRNPNLFNGSKFRIAAQRTRFDGLEADFGITWYKDLMGTNFSKDIEEIKKMGVADFSDPLAYIANPLGVGALIITSDRKCIFLKRSSWTGENPNYLDRPGGHAEPENARLRENLSIVEELDNTAVRTEIFDSVVQEVIDEVNIPRGELSEAELIGSVLLSEIGDRPNWEFLIRCQLTSEEVKRKYLQGSQAEADESTDIVFLDIDDIVLGKLPSMWDSLTLASKGCLYLYYKLNYQTTASKTV